MKLLFYPIILVLLSACSSSTKESVSSHRVPSSTEKENTSSALPKSEIKPEGPIPSLCRKTHDQNAETFIKELDLWTQGNQAGVGKALIDNALYLPTGDKKLPFIILSNSETVLILDHDIPIEQFESLLTLKESELAGRKFLQSLHKNALSRGKKYSKITLLSKLKDELDRGELCNKQGQLKNSKVILQEQKW